MTVPFDGGVSLNNVERPREQKIIPITEALQPDAPECCCTNRHEPYLLNGRMVISLSPACHIHSKPELKWIGRRVGVE